MILLIKVCNVYMHVLVWDVQRRDIWQMLMHILLLQRIVADMSPEQTGKKTAVDEDLLKVLQSDIYSVQHFFMSNKLFPYVLYQHFRLYFESM